MTKCQNNGGGYLISPIVQEYQKTELQKGSAADLTFESFYLSLPYQRCSQDFNKHLR